MKYKIEHTNIFYYESFVDQSMNHIRLKPRTDECQRVLSYRTEITPASMTKEHIDLWGNHVETFFIPEKHEHLEVKTNSIVSIQKSPFLRMIHFTDEMREIFHSELFHKHYLAYLNETPYTFLYKEQIEEITQAVGDPADPVRFSLDLMAYIHQLIVYDGTATHVDTKAYESWPNKKGVCQDYAHIMLAVLRAKGIPARYVSGYLYVGEDSALIGDAATHAWVEVMVPGIGWVGLDPTNNVEALEQHIRIGTGRDYADVSPLQGVYRGGQQTLDVKVSVTLLEH
ncbi:transglutaminase-like protein [Thalassobacillus devorans]|uniref:Transglutaminase-like protein n=1 Tax=Thalassobacillus devorans TaxID=279813 RepID=A0ABQ1PUJ5_9BACI|nr:transglutaminase family protein [Thalassobacillus devorans]NIK29523.1 transglutaminase-like putative cysteine protease [Thalassobacillus devorans]GGD04009.1 transglutaminase-like protein [Thalassobacillus devorans]